MNGTVTITLTHEEWNELSCYLLRNTKSRQAEIDTWESLSKVMEDDGVTPKFPNAPSMKKFEEETRDNVEEYIEIINNYIEKYCFARYNRIPNNTLLTNVLFYAIHS